MYILPAFMSVCIISLTWPWRSEKGIIFSDPQEVTDSCEAPCRCWEVNVGTLEEQAVL